VVGGFGFWNSNAQTERKKGYGEDEVEGGRGEAVCRARTGSGACELPTLGYYNVLYRCT
jgi:hypothetical protein